MSKYLSFVKHIILNVIRNRLFIVLYCDMYHVSYIIMYHLLDVKLSISGDEFLVLLHSLIISHQLYIQVLTFPLN